MVLQCLMERVFLFWINLTRCYLLLLFGFPAFYGAFRTSQVVYIWSKRDKNMQVWQTVFDIYMYNLNGRHVGTKCDKTRQTTLNLDANYNVVVEYLVQTWRIVCRTLCYGCKMVCEKQNGQCGRGSFWILRSSSDSGNQTWCFSLTMRTLILFLWLKNC